MNRLKLLPLMLAAIFTNNVSGFPLFHCRSSSLNRGSQNAPSVSERTGLQKVADKTSMGAWEALRAGRLDDAKCRFNQALLLDSSNALVLWGLGICYAQKGELEESRKSFEKADPMLSNDMNFNVDRIGSSKDARAVKDFDQ